MMKDKSFKFSCSSCSITTGFELRNFGKPLVDVEAKIIRTLIRLT